MTARGHRPARPTHFWTRVKSRLRCALGDHECAAGTLVRGRRGDPRQAYICADCLKSHYDIDPPEHPSMAINAK